MTPKLHQSDPQQGVGGFEPATARNREPRPRPLGPAEFSPPLGDHSPRESPPWGITPLGNHPPGESSPRGITPKKTKNLEPKALATSMPTIQKPWSGGASHSKWLWKWLSQIQVPSHSQAVGGIVLLHKSRNWLIGRACIVVESTRLPRIWRLP